jgi:ribonucleoside-diphosphate reductase alpha chain
MIYNSSIRKRNQAQEVVDMATATVDTRKFLSETKFYEGYSRYIEEDGRYETWDEAVDRVIEMHKGYYKNKGNEITEYYEEARQAYKEQRVLGAQRALQFGGDQLLKHQMRMYNCTSSYADRPAFFGEVFYILLCGAGAGFSVQKHHIAKLPQLQQRTKQAKGYVVEDSIEGWASALDVLMSSYFVGGGKYPEFEARRVFFDLSQIRPKGSKISGGFKAPGPEGLRRSLDKIEHLLQGIVIDSKEPKNIRPIDVYDITMHAADAVLSGGVRRSATICLFSPDDEEMMNAKTGSWYMDNPQRGRSNNSAVIVRDETTPEQFGKIMESVKQFGEPGFVFVESTEHTTNPCVEIGMFPQMDNKSGWQGCNLTEINGGMCNTEEDFYKACRAASILGTLQAGYTDFKFLDETSKKIFDREALLGVSITGWMNNPKVLFDPKILEKGAKIVKEVNREVAEKLGINPAARTTCVKPSGNASVLLQTASGIHAEHSNMYIRNVQMNKESEITQAIMKANPYMVEESVWSAGGTDVVVSFPIIPHKESILKDELIGVTHLEKVKLAQKHWVNAGTNEELCADKGIRHNVSNTIIVEDWDEVEKYVFENRNSFAGISFLSMSGDKDYNQAPNTAVITAKEMVKKYDTGAVFASGMVVDALKCFRNLWDACSTAKGFGEDISLESAENAMKQDWVRRFNQFADNYTDGDITLAEHCLKDAYLLHKWNKIQKNLKPIAWKDDLTAKKYVDVDTLAAAACAGGACEIDF